MATVCAFKKLFLNVPRKRNQIPLASATAWRKISSLETGTQSCVVPSSAVQTFWSCPFLFFISASPFMQPSFSLSFSSQERENEIKKLRTQVSSMGKIMLLKKGCPLEMKGCNFFTFIAAEFPGRSSTWWKIERILWVPSTKSKIYYLDQSPWKQTIEWANHSTVFRCMHPEQGAGKVWEQTGPLCFFLWLAKNLARDFKPITKSGNAKWQLTQNHFSVSYSIENRAIWPCRNLPWTFLQRNVYPAFATGYIAWVYGKSMENQRLIGRLSGRCDSSEKRRGRLCHSTPIFH